MKKAQNEENRNAADILKDLLQLKDKVEALHSEINNKFDPDGDSTECFSLYALEGNIDQVIGEFLHAEYKAGRMTLTAETKEVANG